MSTKIFVGSKVGGKWRGKGNGFGLLLNWGLLPSADGNLCSGKQEDLPILDTIGL